MSTSSVQPETGHSRPAEAAQETSLTALFKQLRRREHRTSVSMIDASFTSALESLWANRTRSFLTMLGIFIGVASVIALLTLTQSAGVYIDNLISGLGANTIIIDPGSSTSGGVVLKQSTQTLTLNDAQSLSHLSHVVAVSPIVSAGAQVVYGNQNWRTRIQGVSTDMQTIQGWDMAQGMWFTASDDAGERAVAVIGDTVAQNLFAPSNTDPVGKTIRVGSQLFRVVGVLAPKGGFNQDDIIFMPVHTALTRLKNSTSVNEIQLEADTSDNVPLVQQAITLTLEQNHHIPKGSPDDFQITTSAQLLQRANQAVAAFSVLLTGIAAISLTVGGIGIMNIMLVSVTERTREIGIRMSIGARRQDIRNQFLIEALMLCLAGGSIGLLLGLLIGWAITGGGLVPLGLPFTVSATTFIMPFVLAAVIGLVFGLYPAVRASRLDPIVALRRAK